MNLRIIKAIGSFQKDLKINFHKVLLQINKILSGKMQQNKRKKILKTSISIMQPTLLLKLLRHMPANMEIIKVNKFQKK